MIRYILDTNVLVDILRGNNSGAKETLLLLGVDHCAIADITVFELLCGAAGSANPEKNRIAIGQLLEQITVLPSSAGYLEAADNKLRLKREGTIIEDLDLLIGCTALHNDCTLVTGNLQHMKRIPGLKLMPWE